MIEMRWLRYEEEETIVPPSYQVQFGKPFEKAVVIKSKLQYRQKYNATIYAGMPDQKFMNQTAQMVWSEWRDVPEVMDGR
jgi:vancomycin resistance protein YoaR